MNLSQAYEMFMRLKSNMDRFIGLYYNTQCVMCIGLKSNMDRFIVSIQRCCNEHFGV